VPTSLNGCLVALFQTQRTELLGRLTGDALDEAILTPEQLMQIQKTLKARGLLPSDAVVDGVIGPATRKAISDWQRANGQRESGFASAIMASTP
jgi:peptidoglycan hydrolase-like protein with peptidoglycan-binding domain